MFVCAFVFYAPLAAQKATAQDAIDAASVARLASERALARDPYWRTLLHYKPTLFDSLESLVDDPQFFFAKDGRTNPEAELAATIEAFFSPPAEGAVHPAARFPARFAWLREKLELRADVFPFDGEAEFRKLRDAINPGGVFLVFPAGYMNSPASMFGHTFLLVEAAGGSRLLSHSVNYGAMTDEAFGPAYAVKGLFGFYRGYYSFLPYYQKIREYGDMDMREMWEYELDLTPREIDRFLMHVVEMQNIFSYYYFITENCSYNLLFLVEAARPESRATDAFNIAVEPIETVKLIDRLGLVRKRDYRPSLYTKIAYESSLLTSAQRSFVRDVCFGRKPVSPFPFPDESEARKAAMWDFAADYLKFLLMDRSVSETEYRKRLLSILSARKNLGKNDTLRGLPEPPPPHEAHGSRKLSTGLSFDGKSLYSDLSFRLTAHEDMDTDPGYAANSQLVVGRAAVRWRWDETTPTFRKFDLLDVVSLPRTDADFFNVCFSLNTGLAMNPTGSDGEALAYRFKTLWGLSAGPASWLQAYAFAGPDAYFSSAYEYLADLQLGGEAGFFTSFGPLKSRFSVSAFTTLFAPVHTRFELAAEGRLALGRNFAVDCRYAWKGDYGIFRHEYGLGVSCFF